MTEEIMMKDCGRTLIKSTLPCDVIVKCPYNGKGCTIECPKVKINEEWLQHASSEPELIGYTITLCGVEYPLNKNWS